MFLKHTWSTADFLVYIRHFEICYVILRSQIDHMLYIYAKVVTRRPNPTAYGHLVHVFSFKWTIQTQNGGHIYMFRGQNFLDPYICIYIHLSHTCAFIRLITGGHKNDMSP